MNPEPIFFKTIGYIYTPFKDPKAVPAMPLYNNELDGTIEINSEYAEGLNDLEGFSHIYVLYQAHRAGKPRLLYKPFMQPSEHGIFATRANCRPNPIGLVVLKLEKVEGNVLQVTGVDMLDGTAVLDVKPYCDRFDKVVRARGGWTQACTEEDE